jgi:hypothetical protein
MMARSRTVVALRLRLLDSRRETQRRWLDVLPQVWATKGVLADDPGKKAAAAAMQGRAARRTLWFPGDVLLVEAAIAVVELKREPG